MGLSSERTLKGRVGELHLQVKDDIVNQLLQEHNIAAHQVKWASRYLDDLNTLVHCSAAIACVAVGGDIKKTIPLLTSWYLFTLSADIFDDIQDGETAKYNAPEAEILSFALLSIALSYHALCKLDVPPQTYRKVDTRMRVAYLSAASGQLKNQTVTSEQIDQNQYLANIIETSAVPLAQYFVCGAYLASRSNEAVENAIYEYGLAIGTCSQLKDDLEDIQTDLRTGNFTLPILHGLAQREHPLFSELQVLIDRKAETPRIREILSEMGSIDDVQRLLFVYLQRAESAIQSVSHLIPKEALELLSWKRK